MHGTALFLLTCVLTCVTCVVCRCYITTTTGWWFILLSANQKAF